MYKLISVDDLKKDLNRMVSYFIEMDKSKYDAAIKCYTNSDKRLFRTQEDFVDYLKFLHGVSCKGYEPHTHNLYIGAFEFPSCVESVNHSASIIFNWCTGELQLQFNRRQYETDIEKEYISSLETRICSVFENWSKGSLFEIDYDKFIGEIYQIVCDQYTTCVKIRFSIKTE